MKKSAGVATLLNAIIPGFGWLYCERIFIGIISLLINTGLLTGLLFLSFYGIGIFVAILYLLFWLISLLSVFYYIKNKKNVPLKLRCRNILIIGGFLLLIDLTISILITLFTSYQSS